MSFLLRIFVAGLTFAAVAWVPDLMATSGPTGAGGDLGLARLLAQGSMFAYGAAFLGGALTSLTPCVYPLIPITVSIFGARQAASRRQAVVLSGLYVLGIAAMYSALGVGAALTGKAFGSVMQNPWVMGAVAVVFAAMAASMFGAFDLQLPAGLQARLSAVGGAGYVGAVAMGLVAGVIAAPCTGPVLAAALAFVATRGSVPFGVGVMFAYALGMGLPFFLLGAFSVSLPKSGPWMDAVKSVFGVALLAAAGVFAKDAVPALQPAFLASRAAALAAATAAGAGVLLGAFSGSFEGTRWRSLAKGVGVALVVGGIVYASGSAQARSTTGAAGLDWIHQDEALALGRARAEGKPVIIDFWADWCTACRELDRTAWSDPRVQAAAKRFVTLKMDGSQESDAFQRVFEKYAVVGMPTVVFIDSHGREMPARVTGATSAEEMLKWLQAAEQACALPAVACVARW
ncbi:MAG TPA: cytochrome c biogenesis protein CcdA [Anaeromyxobacteraceae bacterium]|nr:cytochrome c biogenesis protein CcdA [Anaeromyxobacteraceae bacterium]